MVIQDDVLEKACKEVIETILLILEHAFKGTIYRVGPMPKLQVARVSSGLRLEGTDRLLWGTSSSSGYFPPGKSWEQYRDYPGHVLEAIAWCVEKQKSWTADNPEEDCRSVRKQVCGELEDFHHMEPVLVRNLNP